MPIDRKSALPLIEAGDLTLAMTNAGWTALKEVFAIYGVDIMNLPFDQRAGLINSEVPALIFAAMVGAKDPSPTLRTITLPEGVRIAGPIIHTSQAHPNE